jgi:hypothetical protein
MGNLKPGSEGNSTKTSGTNESPGNAEPQLIVLISEANLINFQREVKSVVSGELVVAQHCNRNQDSNSKYGGVQRHIKIPH